MSGAEALVIMPLPTLDDADTWKAFLEEENAGLHVVTTRGYEEIHLDEESGNVTVQITLDDSWRVQYAGDGRVVIQRREPTLEK